jgi:excisionase family DNA binding protein
MSDKNRLKPRPTPDAVLPPKVRRELAARALVGALDEYVREIVRDIVNAGDWVDQHTSPLGKRAHLEAVRRGDLRAAKHGRRVLVRRADLDSFLESHSVKRRRPASEVDPKEPIDEQRAAEVAAEILDQMGLRMRKR